MNIDQSFIDFLDMLPSSPNMHDHDHSCEPSLSPCGGLEAKAAANLNCPLLKLPDDIFTCIADYLDRDTAWSMKKLCKGMARSKTVNQLLYRYPIQLQDVRDLRLGDWKYRVTGRIRWEAFQEAINDDNRQYVHKLALSHWASIQDFQWIEANLPVLTALDISAIKDFVWTPEETWTWKMLAVACPRLFARLEELEVANWADYTAHSRIEYSYSYGDYRFKQNFRISRRRDGGSVAKLIFPLCTRLKTLAIRERYSGFHTWNEWEVHQRVCCLVDGVQEYCSSTLRKLRVHDYAPYRSLFSTDATAWSRLTDVEIGLYAWMEDRRDRDVIGPIPYRITTGSHHREEEEAFDDKTFDTCKRDHMVLGNNVVQGVGASFEDLLQSLQTISQKYPNIKTKPIHDLHNITLHPFHLVNVMQRRHHFALPNAQNNPQAQADPISNEGVQEALRWLAENCDWKPILAWDSMMCDVFPANLEPNRTFLPKPDVLSRIKAMVSTLRSLSIPIRLSIGDRTNSCPSSGLDGSLYFGDFKILIDEGDNKREMLQPTQASFNLSHIAAMVDELTIQYPVDVPGVGGWMRTMKRPSAAEKVLMQREMTGWQRFWARYACQFTNLKKLTANIPNEIYDDWGRTALPVLLQDQRWEMLTVPDHGGDYGFFGSYFPFSNMRYNHARKRSRTKFVQRVFFRLDGGALHLPSAGKEFDDQARDEKIITDDMLAAQEVMPNRFWPKEEEEASAAATVDQGEKRKREEKEKSDETEGDAQASKKLKTEYQAQVEAANELEERGRDMLTEMAFARRDRSV